MKALKCIMGIILLLLAIILLVDLIPQIINPIQRPSGMLRNYILKITPLGTSLDDVVELINNRNDWKSANLRDYGLYPAYPTEPYMENRERPRIGEKTVSTNVGTYRSLRDFLFLMEIHVAIFWVFDANDVLIDVHIWRGGSI
ncbi:MAG: hypothetical protein FWE27_09950 [Defluviitaleaceae bacterium]|nr:hypothetical protein [Defluviitaleaceae bacterium]